MLRHLTQLSGVSAGWLSVALLGVAVLSYFCGCFNGAVIVSRYILKNDVRNHGSGNAGLTNFHRAFGGPLTAVVLLADAIKMVVAVLFAQWVFGTMNPQLVVFSKYWAGLFCLLGHMFPCMFQFRGGKGILSGGALALMVDWRVACVVWGGFLLLVLATRYVSLGSCWAGFSFPIISGLVFRDGLIGLLSLITGLLVLWQHRGNIHRLLTGTESRFQLRKKGETPPPKTGDGVARPVAGGQISVPSERGPEAPPEQREAVARQPVQEEQEKAPVQSWPAAGPGSQSKSKLQSKSKSKSKSQSKSGKKKGSRKKK